MSEPTLVSLKAVDDALHIAWSDGVTHRLTWKLLRDACPCATCRDQREQGTAGAAAVSSASTTSPGPEAAHSEASRLLPVLSLEEVRPLRVRNMKPVGNYAYGIDFTDGHSTGIYTLEHLRELGEAGHTG